MLLVTISEEAAERAKREAIRDLARARRHGWKAAYDGPLLEGRIGSYRGEEALAALIGKPWKRDPDGFGKPDVHGWSVRYGMKANYGLVIHDRDGNYPYVLVVPGSHELEFEIAGWIRRNEALALKDLGIGRALPGRTKAWVIPRSYLHKWGVK